MHLEFCFYCAKLIDEDGFSLAEEVAGMESTNGGKLSLARTGLSGAKQL